MKKRVFSALLALCLAFSLFGTALAAPAETPSETASTSSSESTTVQENGTEVADSGDSSVSSTGETGNTGTDSSSGENADSNSTELTGTDTTGNDSQTDIDSQSDDAAATAADGAADDAATANATNGIDLYDWNDWNPGGDHGGGGGSTDGTFDHIEIEVAATATLTVNGEPLSADVRVTTNDTFTITATYGSDSITLKQGESGELDGHTIRYTKNAIGDGSTQDDTVELSGSYWTGTKNNPVYYTIEFTKNVTFTANDGTQYTVPVTLSVTTSYWDEGNHCPGVSNSRQWKNGYFVNGSGIDVPATGSSKLNQGVIQITKMVVGLTADEFESKEYSFNILDNTGNLYKQVNITMSSSSDAAIQLVTNVPAGEYTIVENSDSAQIGDYELSTTYQVENESATTESATVTVSAGKTAEVTVTNSYTLSTTTLTLTKEFIGLSDEEVYYILYDQKDGADADQFAFGVNYCNSNGTMYDFGTAGFEMLPGVIIKDGGDFRIVARDYLSDIVSAEALDSADATAKLNKNESGNWVYSITINVPVCTDGTFFTVFEMHGELPGYAKLDTDSVTYTVSSDDTDNTTTNHTGSGKFVCENGKDFDDMKDGASEENYISDGTFRRLNIQDDTTVSFQNHYSGSLDVTKIIGGTNDYADAEEKSYTLTIAPADIDKLDLSNSTTDVQHGLAGKTVSYTVTGSTTRSGTAEIQSNGSFTVEIQADQTIHFTDLPAIQWKVTENEENDASVANYNWTVSYTDQNNDVEDDATHWNGYESDDTIGKTSETDGIASVDSVVSSDAVALVTVTNTYARKTNTLTISKHVSGPMGDTTEDFTFTVELTDTLDNNAAYTKEVENEKSTDSVGWSGSDGTYTLTLSDGESITLTLPYGVKATVEETNAQGHTVYSRVYDTGTTVSNEDFTPETSEKLGYEFKASQTVTLTGVNQSVDFMNYRAAAVPTAVDTDSAAPYLVLTACAAFAGLALAGSIVAVRLRRRRQE